MTRSSSMHKDVMRLVIPGASELDNAITTFVGWLRSFGELSVPIFRPSTRALLDGGPSHSTTGHRCWAQLPSRRWSFARLSSLRLAGCSGLRSAFRLQTRTTRWDSHTATQQPAATTTIARRFTSSSLLESTRCAELRPLWLGLPVRLGVNHTGDQERDAADYDDCPTPTRPSGPARASMRDPRWLDVWSSIAEHALLDYPDLRSRRAHRAAGYTPARVTGGVVNASAYRVLPAHTGAVVFGDAAITRPRRRNLRYVLAAQKPDGRGPTATDGKRAFVDHFHTCFVLEALAKIETPGPERALSRAP